MGPPAALARGLGPGAVAVALGLRLHHRRRYRAICPLRNQREQRCAVPTISHHSARGRSPFPPLRSLRGPSSRSHLIALRGQDRPSRRAISARLRPVCLSGAVWIRKLSCAISSSPIFILLPRTALLRSNGSGSECCTLITWRSHSDASLLWRRTWRPCRSTGG